MSNMYKSFSFLITFLGLLSNGQGRVDGDSLLFVISYDGFAPSYLEKGLTPNMVKFRSEGTTTDHLRNVFPTKTFPNHHSIATGLYPNDHGVMGDNVYDLDLGLLHYGPELYSYSEEIQPIWVTNELSGGKSGCIMWPGSEFSYQQVNCSYTIHYNISMSWEDRLDKAVHFFEEGANLVMLYIEEPDHQGHIGGVSNEAENSVIARVDAFTRLVEERTKHLKVNTVFLSDHGMINTTPSQFINLTAILPLHKEKIYGMSPVMQIYPVDVDEIYRVLVNASVATEAFKVYRNRELPERWNYQSRRRTGPITVVADPPYAFDDMWQTIVEYHEKYNVNITNTTQFGIHGYDNALPSMHSFFMAKGPAIKQRHTVDPFDTVDLFHLFCEILQIKPPFISGNRDNILDILASHVTPQPLSLTQIVLITCSVAFVVVATFGAVFLVKKRSQNTQVVPPYIYDEPEPLEEQKLLEINTRTLPDLKL